MSATHTVLSPRALKPASGSGVARWFRALVGRPAPRAQVIAPTQVPLGAELAVSWRLDFGRRSITNVTVALVGSEVARQRLSARTGISIVTETHPFVTLEIDRQMPDHGAREAHGRGAVRAPAALVPTVTGRLNEIAWAVVIEAAHQAELVWRDEFPLVALPAVRP
ncbi:MAG TPA: hypothetical protein VGP64_09065 [Polyangia bacterium]|jgi:hypothetical protein